MALAHVDSPGSYRRVRGGVLLAVHVPMSMVVNGGRQVAGVGVGVGGVGAVGWPEMAEPVLGPPALSDEQGWWTSEFGRIAELHGLLVGQQKVLSLDSKKSRAAARSRLRKKAVEAEVKMTATELNDLAEDDPTVRDSDERAVIVEMLTSSSTCSVGRTPPADLPGTCQWHSGSPAYLVRTVVRGTNLKGANANEDTAWPDGFDPTAAGVIFD